MTDLPSIAVDGLGKKFCPAFRRSLAYAAVDVAARLIPGDKPPPYLRKGEFWALRDISFEVGKGEALAIIGHNGAGKSTLLKIIYGLLRTDAGSSEVSGRIGALIELGAGINPLLTARENVVVVAMIHGCSRRHALSMIPDVLAFAELQAVADIEVRSFSTGMKARLSYAIVATLQLDILLIDEVLAVGDIAFQRKCMNHLQRFMDGGGTVLLVSHAAHHVQGLCRRAILLDRGRVIAQGATGEVVHRYLETRPPSSASAPGEEISNASEIAVIEHLTLTSPDGGTARSGAPAVLRLGLSCTARQRVYCGISLWSADGWTCITSTFDSSPRELAVGHHTLECAIDVLPLMAGSYLARPILADSTALSPLILAGAASEGITFSVTGETDLFTNGQRNMGQLVTMKASWVRSNR